MAWLIIFKERFTVETNTIRTNRYTREVRSRTNTIYITNANNIDIIIIKNTEVLPIWNRFIIDTSNVARNVSFSNEKEVSSKGKQVTSVPFN